MDTPRTSADVAVVGGGPAGCAAAIWLARAGLHVVLVDRARFPRDKCCGDGLTTAALRHLEALGLRPDHVESWQPVSEVWMRSPSGRVATYPLPRHRGQYAAVARRFDLDAALLDVARASGVEVHDGHALQGAQAGDDQVTLHVNGIGQIDAPYAVGADGMWSPLRRALGAGDEGGYLGEGHALRQYFSGVGSAAHEMWVWFEPDLLPGYAWSFPLPGGGANVGYGLSRSQRDQQDRGDVRHRRRSTGQMAELWSELLARPQLRQVLGPDATPSSPLRAWPIPARIHRSSLAAAAGRALFVGDAARAADPMTGEGIGQALETASLAARAILAAGPGRPGLAARRYRTEIGRGLRIDNALSRVLLHGLEHRRGARAAVRATAATSWSRANFGRWMFEDYPRALLLTPGRWRPGMLHRPGAYCP